jgi:polyhydroxybutyrate depolymerase
MTALLLALLSSGVAASQEPYNGSLTHGGVQRQYIVYVPEDVPSSSVGLIVAMHGYSGSAESIMTYSGLNALADEFGFVVAYPQGTEDQQGNAFFNVGYGFHTDSSVDDVGYILTLVEHLVAKHSIDPLRVYATGMSNGGDMSYLLACKAADVFRAIAPVAGTMMVATMNHCTPSRPIPVLAINGTADNVTRYAGDYDDADGWGAYHSVNQVINLWAENAIAQAQASATLNFADDFSISVDRYSAATGTTQVILYRVEGGGHDWPGARFAWWDLRRLLSVYAMGFGEHRSFDASRYIAKFFNKNS